MPLGTFVCVWMLTRIRYILSVVTFAPVKVKIRHCSVLANSQIINVWCTKVPPFLVIVHSFCRSWFAVISTSNVYITWVMAIRQVNEQLSSVSAKLHYTDTGYGHVVQHHQRISSQLAVQQICHIAMPEPNISTSEMEMMRWCPGLVDSDILVHFIISILLSLVVLCRGINWLIEISKQEKENFCRWLTDFLKLTRFGHRKRHASELQTYN